MSIKKTLKRRYCTICLKKRYEHKMIKIYLGLIRENKFYCPDCLESVESKVIVLEDRGVKKRVPLYNNYDCYFK
jgi:hypothetical protein